MKSRYELTLKVEVMVTTDKPQLSKELRDKVALAYSSAVLTWGHSVEDGEYEIFGKDAVFFEEDDDDLQPCQVSSQQNLTLTDAERECVEWAEDIAGNCEEFDRVDTLRNLLERTK